MHHLTAVAIKWSCIQDSSYCYGQLPMAEFITKMMYVYEAVDAVLRYLPPVGWSATHRGRSSWLRVVPLAEPPPASRSSSKTRPPPFWLPAFPPLSVGSALCSQKPARRKSARRRYARRHLPMTRFPNGNRAILPVLPRSAHWASLGVVHGGTSILGSFHKKVGWERRGAHTVTSCWQPPIRYYGW
jgi:hypothetical protein